MIILVALALAGCGGTSEPTPWTPPLTGGFEHAGDLGDTSFTEVRKLDGAYRVVTACDTRSPTISWDAATKKLTIAGEQETEELAIDGFSAGDNGLDVAVRDATGDGGLLHVYYADRARVPPVDVSGFHAPPGDFWPDSRLDDLEQVTQAQSDCFDAGEPPPDLAWAPDAWSSAEPDCVVVAVDKGAAKVTIDGGQGPGTWVVETVGSRKDGRHDLTLRKDGAPKDASGLRALRVDPDGDGVRLWLPGDPGSRSRRFVPGATCTPGAATDAIGVLATLPAKWVPVTTVGGQLVDPAPCEGGTTLTFDRDAHGWRIVVGYGEAEGEVRVEGGRVTPHGLELDGADPYTGSKNVLGLFFDDPSRTSMRVDGFGMPGPAGAAWIPADRAATLAHPNCAAPADAPAPAPPPASP